MVPARTLGGGHVLAVAHESSVQEHHTTTQQIPSCSYT
jgi:molybdenum cofactor biosynthesis enzyme